MVDKSPATALPEHLLERCQWDEQNPQAGDFVIYWMRNAVRTDENPALDVARLLAAQLSCPLLIYHAISEHYAFASDRHHTFMLEGARDVQNEFHAMGISYAFHLATPGDREPHLVELAKQAKYLVTELMPVDPARRFLRALKNQVNTPVISVDTACVAPMPLISKPFVRAFKFRSATKKIFAERLTRAWPKLDVSDQPFPLDTLPFRPIDLQTESIPELVAQCEIDHSVGAVVDSIGGSRAGYQRWERFKEKDLRGYAKKRNNALVDGVSRMSPYLHYGMVSPLRIAREAANMDHAGAEKYLDELLIWRELAYAFCYHRVDHDQWSAIPEWAQETLQKHSKDLREQELSWETLARGETGDRLWDAAQKSLLMQGELHNNVRMTWGKAILNWQSTPQVALQMIIDLNHRYALDGRDPASYGGILWCLGQFDRPFEPPTHVLGTVRPRPTSQHASRLDPEKFLAKVTKPRFQSPSKVAIIGAGLSGLIAARTLKDHGIDVQVFEKSRGVGGRMATRRIDDQHSNFDHGAQYFTVRDDRFRRYVESWKQQGLVAQWPDPALGAEQTIVVLKDGGVVSESSPGMRYVGVPAMNRICKHLAEDLDVRKQTRVTRMTSTETGLEIFDENGEHLGQFDQAVVSIPAEQAAMLLAEDREMTEALNRIQMNPCWAVMAGFEKPLTDQWVGAFVHDSPLSWAARNSTKPGRNKKVEHLILHANPDWTASHWESPAEEVAEEMLQEFWRVSGLTPQVPNHLRGHRWKYAIPSSDQAGQCLFDCTERIAICGDWVVGGRVEGAFLSGMAAAGRILGARQPLVSGLPNQRELFPA